MKYIFEFVLMEFIIAWMGLVNYKLIFVISEIILFFVFSIYMFKSKKSNLNNQYLMWFTCFIVSVFITTASRVDLSILASEMLSILQIFVFLYLIYFYIVYKPDRIELILNYIIIGLYITLFIIILKSPIALLISTRMGTQIGYNENTFGIMYSYGSLICAYKYHKNNKIFYLLSIFIFIVAVLLSGSRTALLILIISIMIYLLLNNKNKNIVSNFKIIIVILFIIILILYLIFNNPILYTIVGYRLENAVTFTKGDVANEGSIYKRVDLLREGWRWFQESPIMGSGFGSFENFSIYKTYVHNNYIQMLVSGGIYGFIVYYSIFIIIIYKNIKLFRKLKKYNDMQKNMIALSISLIIGLMIADFGSVNYYKEQYQLYLMVSIALTQTLYHEL